MDEQGWSKLYSGSAVSESPPGASWFYVIKGTGCEAEMRLGREVFRKGDLRMEGGCSMSLFAQYVGISSLKTMEHFFSSST